MVREAYPPIEKYTDNVSNGTSDPEEASQYSMPKDADHPNIFLGEEGPLRVWVSYEVPTRSTYTKMLEVHPPRFAYVGPRS